MHTVPDMRNGNLILKWEAGEDCFFNILKKQKSYLFNPFILFYLKRQNTFSKHTRFALKLKLDDFKDLCKEE